MSAGATPPSFAAASGALRPPPDGPVRPGGRGAAEARRDPLRVLVITRIFPNAQEPLSSPFNRQQFAALGRLCHVEIMATIPWFPGAGVLGRLARAGHAVRLAAVPARDVIDGLAVVHPRVVYVPRFGAALSGALEVASLARAVLARRHRVDVVLGSWAYPDGAAAVALARMIGVPAVIKAHGSDLNVLGAMRGPRANLALALPRAARVVAVSRALGDKASELGAPRSRVEIVPNGIDTSLFHVRDAAEARAALGLPPAGRIILYCGRLERPKGVFDLLDAFAGIAGQAEDLSLVLLGEGSARAEAEARAKPFGARVRFVGARPLAEVPVWLAASTLVTLPSWNEGSPNVVREALACGRPVVGTSVGGIPELVTDDALGRLVPARSPAELGRALLSAAGTEFDAAYIAAQGGGSWEDSAARLLGVLRAARRDHDSVKTGAAG
jgi:teichuronic acid biosynthesis glycosyltransferase TuaC